MAQINSYTDLVVWQKSHRLVLGIIQTSKYFARTAEARIVKQQLIRAATSVPANVAEGYGGVGGQAYKNYLTIAKRSASEADCWLRLGCDLGYINAHAHQQLVGLREEVTRMLGRMIRKL